MRRPYDNEVPNSLSSLQYEGTTSSSCAVPTVGHRLPVQRARSPTQFLAEFDDICSAIHIARQPWSLRRRIHNNILLAVKVIQIFRF